MLTEIVTAPHRDIGHTGSQQSQTPLCLFYFSGILKDDQTPREIDLSCQAADAAG
ncbi:hypothetical protein GCM10027295_22170 [Pseudaeromonas pectinilytica]